MDCRLHPIFSLVLAVNLLPIAMVAGADTTVPSGVILGNQTWAAAGSIYQVEGDITVAALAALTIDLGTDVDAAPFDAVAGGSDSSRVEFIVDGGELVLQPSPASPITIGPQPGQSTTSWVGLDIRSGQLTVSGTPTQVGGNLFLRAGAVHSGISGTIELDGNLQLSGTLDMSPLVGGTIGTEFVLYDLASGRSVVGSFAGLPEGSTFEQSGSFYSITYAGGDGNDVVLSIVAPPAVPVMGPGAVALLLLCLSAVAMARAKRPAD